MKVLKKGKKYIRVVPLPNEWLGPKEVTRKAGTKNIYQKSFQKLKSLLDDGWEYCPKSKEQKKKNKKS